MSKSDFWNFLLWFFRRSYNFHWFSSWLWITQSIVFMCAFIVILDLNVRFFFWKKKIGLDKMRCELLKQYRSPGSTCHCSPLRHPCINVCNHSSNLDWDDWTDERERETHTHTTDLNIILGMHNGNKCICNDGSESGIKQPKYAAGKRRHYTANTTNTVWWHSAKYCHKFGTWKVNFRMVRTRHLCINANTSRCPCDYNWHECWTICTRFTPIPSMQTQWQSQSQ